MDFIAQSLDLYPEPAALYDSSLTLVAANAAAWEWILSLPDDFPDQEDWREKTGLGALLRTALDDGSAAAEVMWGQVHVTKLAGGFELARPDVLVASLGAELDHRRLLLALKVNEVTQKSLSTLNTAMTLAQGAMRANEQLLCDFNAATRQFFDTPKRG